MNKKIQIIKNIIVISIIIFITVITFIPAVIPVFAGSLTPSKVTISDSRSGRAATTHTYNFTTATTAVITTITFQYCTTASGVCTMPPGLITTSAVQGSLTGIGASTSNVASNGTITLTVTSPASINSGVAITIPYTTITNPTTADTTSFVRISTGTDTSVVAFAVLTSSSVAMTASVDPTFTFSLVAVNTAGSVNSATTNITTTASTIPFGSLTSGSTKIGAIDTTVTTNAPVGYTITIAAAANPPLVDGGNNIDYHTLTNVAPGAWTSPAGSAPNVNTGFVGYTTNEATLGTGTAGRFVGNKWAGLITTPEEVAYSAVGGAARTVRVGFQAEVNGLQPSGNYTGTVLLVATPTY